MGASPPVCSVVSRPATCHQQQVCRRAEESWYLDWDLMLHLAIHITAIINPAQTVGVTRHSATTSKAMTHCRDFTDHLSRIMLGIALKTDLFRDRFAIVSDDISYI